LATLKKILDLLPRFNISQYLALKIAAIYKKQNTMSLEQRINQDIKTAMLAKDQTALRGLRAIKSAILLALTEAGAPDELSTEREIQILTKMAKQRRESLDIYQKQNRADLAQKEQEEIDIIEKYLPAQMSPDELETALRQIIAQVGATSVKDMGKVIGTANQQLQGRAEGKLIAETVKKLLG